MRMRARVHMCVYVCVCDLRVLFCVCVYEWCGGGDAGVDIYVQRSVFSTS